MAQAVSGLQSTASLELQTSSLTTFRCTGRLLNTLFQSTKASSRVEPLDTLLSAVKTNLDEILEQENEDPTKHLVAVFRVAQALELALRCMTTTPAAQTLILVRDCVSPAAKLALVRFSLFSFCKR